MKVRSDFDQNGSMQTISKEKEPGNTTPTSRAQASAVMTHELPYPYSLSLLIIYVNCIMHRLWTLTVSLFWSLAASSSLPREFCGRKWEHKGM